MAGDKHDFDNPAPYVEISITRAEVDGELYAPDSEIKFNASLRIDSIEEAATKLGIQFWEAMHHETPTQIYYDWCWPKEEGKE